MFNMLRPLNLIALVSTTALAACSTSTTNSGSNGTAHGFIQTSAASTSAASEEASSATARRANLNISKAALPSGQIAMSTATTNGTESDSIAQMSQGARARSPISGTPALSVLAGSAYKFAPVFTVAAGRPPTFVIANCPSWATFNPVTGLLSGTPSTADVGTYPEISISAIVEGGRVESLPSFSIAVTELATGSATLTWEAPLQNTDGTVVGDLAGFRIYYGTDPNSLDQSVDVAGTALSAYTVRNLLPGTWYFQIQAYSGSSIGSASTIVSKEVI